MCFVLFNLKSIINGILESFNITIIDFWNRLTSWFINPGNVIFTSAVGFVEYYIPWVDKSRGQPHQKSIIVFYWTPNECFSVIPL
jgi:hypothetical protein